MGEGSNQELFKGYGVSVLQNEMLSGDRPHNHVNVFNATKMVKMIKTYQLKMIKTVKMIKIVPFPTI